MNEINPNIITLNPIKQNDFVIMGGGHWVMKISMDTGVITLNPEISQEQAIHDFAAALNNWVSAYRDLTTEK